MVCHPGITDVAKSMDTMVCTESTKGVANPASINDTVSYLDQVFAAPSQPRLNAPYANFEILLVALSLIVAKSGINPIYQNTNETVKYVLIANTSHYNGELKLTHNEPKVFGNGNAQ